MKTKISIIGMGNVGSATAFALAHKKIADEIVMLDIVKDVLEGHSLDLSHSLAWDSQGRVFHGDYPDIKGSRIILVCAGIGRKPGLTDRMQLMADNATTVRNIAESIREFAPGAIVITLTNPLDVMNHIMWKATGFPREHIIGQGGLLDSLRFRWALSQVLEIHPSQIEAFVLGEHGNSKVPIFSKVLVKGKKRSLTVEQKMKTTELIEKANEAVIKKKGATVFGPAQALVKMVEAIIYDKKEMIPCSINLKGEYGHKDVSIGVPVVLGRNGAEKIEEWELEHSESVAFNRSAERIKDFIVKI